jgi:diguanylate cyclase (GGDEF)-like protein
MTWPGFEQALADARMAANEEHSVLYFDMDQLHLLNDMLGRETGDQALREMGAIISRILGSNPTTRVTSDSFAALLLGTDANDACRLGMEICAELHELEYTADGQSFRPSVSIGVAPLDDRESGAASSLLVPAQIACQAAKDRGRNRVELYESGDQSIMRRMDDLNQVGSIRSAIEGGRLVLFAQPIEQISCIPDVSYHELLVRMLDTSGQPVPPSEFMGAAERYQLMEDLDRWVVTKAIETLREELNDPQGKPIRFAINLSGQSIGSEKFLDFFTHHLLHSGVDPTRLCLEITETVAVGNLNKAQHFISELRKLGCQFSLDDFGTGLSSFAYLKMFSVDKLKIDGSFIVDICDNEVSHSMVTAIAEIARVMGIETVAEYVQSEEILDAVKGIGVNWAQGYHVSEPVRLSELFENSTIVDKADLADVEASLLDQLPA